MNSVPPALTASATFTVGEDDTAQALGSGSLPVLATPRLLAWCEQVTCTAVVPLLGERTTSVGTRVELEHLRPTAIGGAVEVQVTSVYTEPKLVRFSVVARSAGKVLATGEVTRVVVDAERFLSRLS